MIIIKGTETDLLEVSELIPTRFNHTKAFLTLE